jgi:hypothetical protein
MLHTIIYEAQVKIKITILVLIAICFISLVQKKSRRTVKKSEELLLLLFVHFRHINGREKMHSDHPYEYRKLDRLQHTIKTVIITKNTVRTGSET